MVERQYEDDVHKGCAALALGWYDLYSEGRAMITRYRVEIFWCVKGLRALDPDPFLPL